MAWQWSTAQLLTWDDNGLTATVSFSNSKDPETWLIGSKHYCAERDSPNRINELLHLRVGVHMYVIGRLIIVWPWNGYARTRQQTNWKMTIWLHGLAHKNKCGLCLVVFDLVPENILEINWHRTSNQMHLWVFHNRKTKEALFWFC